MEAAAHIKNVCCWSAPKDIRQIEYLMEQKRGKLHWWQTSLPKQQKLYKNSTNIIQWAPISVWQLWLKWYSIKCNVNIDQSQPEKSWPATEAIDAERVRLRIQQKIGSNIFISDHYFKKIHWPTCYRCCFRCSRK